MTVTPDPGVSTDELQRAAAGDTAAWQLLLQRYHARLQRMITLRLDPRVRQRVDASDVLQETYAHAVERLPKYLADPDVPFFLWLRRLAGHRLYKLHRRHLGAQARTVRGEVSIDRGVPEATTAVLAGRLLGREPRPSEAARHVERRQRLEQALDLLDPISREMLALRHFEQMTIAESALELDITEAAAAKRYLRALAKLRQVLSQKDGEDSL